MLAGFMLGQGNMRLESSMFLVVNISPAKAQEVTDPQRCTGRHDDHRIVAILAPEQEVVGEVLKLFFVSDRFGCSHNENAPLHDARRLTAKGNVTVYKVCYYYSRLQVLFQPLN